MVSLFSKLSSHKLYVLSWYRYTLRNTFKHLNSYELSIRVRNVIKKTIRKHQNNKSSWSVCCLLKDLRLLNVHLTNYDLTSIISLLGEYSRAPVKSEMKLLALPQKTVRNSDIDREKHIIRRYLYRKRSQLLIPNNIPQIYLEKLIIPLVKHDMYMKVLHRIEWKLAKGPPNTYLSYTIVGQNKFWFVRSAINRRQRQSKALGLYIRTIRSKSQKNLDLWNKCEEFVKWAALEAIWESYLETNKIVNYRIVSDFGIALSNLPNEPNLTLNKNGQYQTINIPIQLIEWLTPLKESFESLQKQNSTVAIKLQNNKERIMNGQFQKFDITSKNIYELRLARYRKMLKQDLPNVNPFIQGCDLGSILKKWKLIDPNKYF